MPTNSRVLKVSGGAGDQVRSVIKGPFPSVTRLCPQTVESLRSLGGAGDQVRSVILEMVVKYRQASGRLFERYIH